MDLTRFDSPDLRYSWSPPARGFLVTLLFLECIPPEAATMRVSTTAVLAALLCATTVIAAGMEQLAAVLPSCAVGSLILPAEIQLRVDGN